jgi:predicted branched-subunit amino acid permease
MLFTQEQELLIAFFFICIAFGLLMIEKIFNWLYED